MGVLFKYWQIIAKKTILKLLCSAFISVALSLFLLVFGRSVVGNFIGVNENFYLKYYYDIMNGEDAEKRVFTVPDSITIFNLQNYRNRHDIATILSKIYDLSPRIIGLDVFFKQNPDISNETNKELIYALTKVQSKLVVPCNYYSTPDGLIGTNYPFFYSTDGLEKITYASPVSHDFYSYYKYDDSSISNKDAKAPVLPRMSIEIARQANIDIEEYDSEFYVNYSKKDFSQIILDDTLDIRLSNIKDRIILIGDMSEIKDMTRLPFNFGKQQEISGIEDIAYSLISIKKNRNLTIEQQARYKGFQDWSPIASIILSFLLSLIFVRLQQKYKMFKDDALNKKRSFAIIAYLLLPIIFILAEMVVVLICYAITYFTNTIPDLFISMVTIALITLSIDITNIIWNKR